MRCLCSVIGRSCYKHHFCCDKTSVMTSTCLSWQNISFVATKVCVSWQTSCCHDKHTFVTTKGMFLLQQTHFVGVVLLRQIFVATKVLYMHFVTYVILSCQKFCRNKRIFCCDKRCILSQQKCLSWQNLSQQKWSLRQLPSVIVYADPTPTQTPVGLIRP